MIKENAQKRKEDYEKVLNQLKEKAKDDQAVVAPMVDESDL